MSRNLCWLSDEEWYRIGPYLPKGRRGARRVDDRRVLSGIIHMLRTGARWRDCPGDYGPYATIYNRFNRWSKQGVWEDIFYALTPDRRPSIRCQKAARMAGRPRLRGRHPTQSDPQEPLSMGQGHLPRPQRHRTDVLPSQGLPPRRHSLRQTRRYLPLRRHHRSNRRMVDQLSPNPSNQLTA